MKQIGILWLGFLLLCGCRTAERPANSAANPRARDILVYFQGLPGRSEKRLVSGQFSNFGDGASLRLFKQIHERTGLWPAILGVDYADFPTGGLTCAAPNRAAIEYWNEGGLVTVSAHLYNPGRTNQLGGLRDKGVNLGELLATNTEVHVRWMRELDTVAAGLQELKNAGVVVLWRPFHEMNGDWFWWCGKDPEKFKQLWRQMFDYFTFTKRLDNLLWVYAPNQGALTTTYYPGDQFVDFVGLDAYTDYIDPAHIRGYAEIARINKPFGFSEFGPHAPSNPPGNYDYLRFLHGVQQNFPRAVYFMSWNGNWSLGRNTNVTEFLSNPWIVNREDLPKGLAGPIP